MKIFKYPVQFGPFSLDLPYGAKVLSVGVQENQPFLWAQVQEAGNPPETRLFRVYGTGHLMREDEIAFIGTFQLDGGALIFHLFEVSK